jgi:hypothetical protein
MMIIGILAAVVVGYVLLATAVAFKSIPDIKHYRRVRNVNVSLLTEAHHGHDTTPSPRAG